MLQHSGWHDLYCPSSTFCCCVQPSASSVTVQPVIMSLPSLWMGGPDAPCTVQRVSCHKVTSVILGARSDAYDGAGYIPDSLKAVDAEIRRRQQAAKAPEPELAEAPPAALDGPPTPTTAEEPLSGRSLLARVSMRFR